MESPPSDAIPAACPGMGSEQAGKSSTCYGCPNQSACASGTAAGPDLDKVAIAEKLGAVGQVVLVMANKGGCGKSTVAAQLAYQLAADDSQEVGYLDVDLTGPSGPHLFSVADEEVHQAQTGWQPVSARDNLAVMSILGRTPRLAHRRLPAGHLRRAHHRGAVPRRAAQRVGLVGDHAAGDGAAGCTQAGQFLSQGASASARRGGEHVRVCVSVLRPPRAGVCPHDRRRAGDERPAARAAAWSDSAGSGADASVRIRHRPQRQRVAGIRCGARLDHQVAGGGRRWGVAERVRRAVNSGSGVIVNSGIVKLGWYVYRHVDRIPTEFSSLSHGYS
eukprot:ctg_726.g386